MLANLRIEQESRAILPQYVQIPIAFEVVSVLDVHAVEHGLGGLVLTERRLETSYVKDYDAAESEGPSSWAKRWDISNWGVLSAYRNGERVGGCVIAYDTQGVEKLEGRKDVAALWDIRVHPAFRRAGVGARLFEATIAWAWERQCRRLKVETQNINVPACRFYAKHGCALASINRFAYAAFPDEVELVWQCKLENEPLPHLHRVGIANYEWHYVKLGDFSYHVLPPSQVKPYLLEWVRREWETDQAEFPDQRWTLEWLDLLPRMHFRLEELPLERIRLRPELMAYKTDADDFLTSLMARAQEREESLLRGVSTEPLLVNRAGYELMDGYTRYMVLKKHLQQRVLAYVGTVASEHGC